MVRARDARLGESGSSSIAKVISTHPSTEDQQITADKLYSFAGKDEALFVFEKVE
jgi:hypothetical protein